VSQEAFPGNTTKITLLFVLLVTAFALTAPAQVTLTQISTDPFKNAIAQHATEVEAAAASNGNTIVTIFQQGRFFNGGGSSDNGWATSLDGGTTWQHGSLPGLTATGGGNGKYDRATDPGVTYDAKHKMWLVANLPLYNNGRGSTAMLVSRSSDGIHWANPVTATPVYTKPDKTWISCDSYNKSPNYGNCYAEWDDNSAGDIVYFAVSSDGGKTWGTPVQPSTKPAMFGLNAVTTHNGTVIAPGANAFDTQVQSTTSTDGGKTFGAPVVVANISKHTASDTLRDLVLPVSAIDNGGTVYTVWQDCSFRSGCAENDIVMSTTTDGTTWTAVARIPIDDVTSTVDHFLPGIAIEAQTSGNHAHIGINYYFYPDASCVASACQLEAGYISSTDGGLTWNAPVQLTGAMTPQWFPNTNQGFMPGDYTSLAFANGLGYPIVGVAQANSGTTLNVSMNVPATGLADGAGIYSSIGERPIPGAHSDAPPLKAPVCDRCRDHEED
jgi:hypothetical protein